MYMSYISWKFQSLALPLKKHQQVSLRLFICWTVEEQRSSICSWNKRSSICNTTPYTENFKTLNASHDCTIRNSYIHIAGCTERTSFLLIMTAKLACGMCKSLRHRNIKKTTRKKSMSSAPGVQNISHVQGTVRRQRLPVPQPCN